MKFSGFASWALLAAAVSAIPTSIVEEGHLLNKRAAITDAANIGYATQNGGTKGGVGGTTTTVTNLAQLSAAANASGPGIVIIQGNIVGKAKVQVGSDKTIVGKTGSSLEGIGLTILGQKNVIIRNVKISKVEAAYGDAITIQLSKNVWVDHCDLSATRDGDKDFYDGLTDLSHAADWVTISHTYFHDHSKGSLVGHSDNNAAEDTGTLRVTYANNHFFNVRSRGPLLRFGTAHVYNQYYNTMDTGLNTRMGAQALIQSSVFENVGKKAIFSESSKETGYAVAIDVVLGGQSANTAPVGKLTASSPPYSYSLLGSANVKAAVTKEAGQTLGF
ncbi:pectate lyase 2 [Colletotrichum higginsianum]|uniref:Pectate lyase 2 n=2 Tax=Colletotrichum higginsianum TaxID=80884 RepID=H1V3Q4_COLHI|nr:Pectate lyase 2 [Colletotrichum higginsianum IMI 349063]OBR06451.1 Pectate lyase 2 [Colletotrichum higginsianum IMI 349063]TIC97624.1 Pectate lyase plyB [Colletotrichum higginsianum]GJD04335.1 pectate lyase 2 [Colletotrichum higginsianum]CCF34856.1 pectate lyase 2 [Colletotrichum higginsianum]